MQLAHNLSSLANLLDIIVVIHVTSRILISNSSVESQHPKGMPRLIRKVPKSELHII